MTINFLQVMLGIKARYELKYLLENTFYNDLISMATSFSLKGEGDLPN